MQARVLEVFSELQQRLGFATLFISHDLAVVGMLADRIGVLYRGELVEYGDGQQVLTDPQHPYTQRLLASVPVPDPVEQQSRKKPLRPTVPPKTDPAAQEGAGFAVGSCRGRAGHVKEYSA